MKDLVRRGCLASLTALAAACALAPSAGAVTLPEGFQHHPELTGLTRPTKIAWAPDGRRFVAEKDGVLRVAGSSGTASQVLLDISSKVNNAGDRGLLGLAVDSDFAGSHPYLYLLYTYDVEKDTDPDTEDGMVSQLLRLKINASNAILEQTLLLGSHVSGTCPTPADTLDCIPADGTSHSVGTVISAPDGTLFVGNGDAAGFDGLDPLALRTYNEASMAGKIMHIDREGKGLAGHPFCPGQVDLSFVCTKLWAKGFRNPFRFTRRPNGFLMVGDVGWSSDEEMDAIWRGGRNYGWPCYEGVIRTPMWKDQAECQPQYASEGTEQGADGPIHAYAHQGSSAILAGPEYTGGSYPHDFDGTVFYGDYTAGFLKRMRLDAQGGFAGTVDFADDWHGVDLTAAPDGELTWAEPGDWGDGHGTIERIVYRPSSGMLPGPVPGTPRKAPSKVDTRGPRIGFNPVRGLYLRRHLLRGVADDGSGVKAVSIALGRVQGHGCRWLVAKPRRLARKASSCAHPRWVAARIDGRRWSVRLSKAMRAGRYRVRFKAIDGVGNRSDRLRDGSRSARLRLLATSR